MAWLTDALGGPILAWEVRRATRRYYWPVLHIGYCAWLALQALALFGSVNLNPPPDDPWSAPRSRLTRHREEHELHDQFLHSYQGTLLKYQLVIIVAITPALTASSLGQEKKRGTLFALFCTQLTSRQILMGLLLGRLCVLMPLMITIVPALVIMITSTEQGYLPILLAYVHQVTIAFAFGCAGLLFGIWIRKATDAVLAAYFFLGLAYLLVETYAAYVPGASVFFPLHGLDNLLDEKPLGEFLAHL